jgi:F420-0:gamma-glutamyl ligase
MHLDWATEIARLAQSGTTVVFDDVWQEAGILKGKGETAIPYFVAHGFKITKIGKNSATLIWI